jgi:addiction module RelB/DinJ family antitoxin
MNEVTEIKAVIDIEKNKKVNKIFNQLGINHSEAINIFYSLIIQNNGLPFQFIRSEDLEKKDIKQHLEESLSKNHELGKLLAE